MRIESRMRSGFLVICWILVSVAAFGQEFIFNAYTPRYNVDELEFRFICTDSKGLVYVGTNNGLFHFDGIEARQVVEGNFTAGHIDGNRIFLGEVDGRFSEYHLREKQFLNQAVMTDSVAISCIQTHDEIRLVGTAGAGLYMIDQSDTISITSQSSGISDDFIYAVEWFDDKIWMGTDRGSNRLSSSGELEETYPETGITKSVEVDSGRLFISGYTAGILNLDSRLSQVDDRKYIDELISCSGTLVSLQGGKLFCKLYESWKPVDVRNDVVDIAKLPSGEVVSIHANGDIGMVDLSFVHFDLDFEQEISALYQSDSLLYVATPGVISIVEIGTGKQVDQIEIGPDMIVVDLAILGGQLYCGTFNRGLIEVNLKSKALRTVEGLPDESVLSLSVADEVLWISTLSGLSQYTPTHPVAVPFPAPMPSTYIYKVFATDSALWLGSDGHGVFRIQGEHSERIPIGKGEVKQRAYDIAADRFGNLFAMVLEEGLVKYDLQTKSFDSVGCLKSSDYASFGVTGEGHALLVGQEELKVWDGRREQTFQSDYFPEKLSGSYINTFSDWPGEWLYFASGKGLYGYRSSAYQTEPILELTSWEVNSEARPLSKSVFPSSEQNHSFRFSTNTFSDAESESIRIRLAGYEESFKRVNTREVTFSKLPPGNYTLEALYGDGENALPIELAEFRIKRPLYMQWWFLLFVLFVLGAVVYVLVKVRVNRLTRSRLAEQKLLESELSLLRSQVNPHFLFNSFNTLMNLIEDSPAEANEYLQRLSDFYRRMLEKNQDQVVSLGEELKMAQEYCYLQSKRFGDSFKFVMNVGPEWQTSLVPVLTLQLLIENAVKHNVISKSKPLEIIFEKVGDSFCLKNRVVPKREPTDGTGLGLENIKKRYESLFKAQVEVEIVDGWFNVYLPIVN